MKHIFWLLLRLTTLSTLMLPVLLTGQPATLDSLEQLLKQELPPPEQFKINLELANQYLRVNPEPGFAFAKTAMDVAEATQDKEQLALARICLADYECLTGGFEPAKKMVHRALTLQPTPTISVQLEGYNLLGNIFFYQSRPDSAKYYYEKMEALVRQIEDPPISIQQSAATALLNQGSAFRHLGQRDSAIQHYEKALEAATAINYKEILPYVLENLANLQIDQEAGIAYYLEAIELDQAMGNNSHLAILYDNLSNIYGNMGDTLQELTYREKTWQLIREYQFVNKELAIALVDYGLLLLEQSEPDKAEKVLSYALEMGKKMQDQSSISYALAVQARLYFVRNNTTEALNHLSEAEKSARAGADPGIFIYSLLNISELYILLGQSSRAIPLLEECQRTAIQVELPHLEGEAAQLLSKAYRASGDYKQALLAYEESRAISDSLSAAENRSAIQEIRTRYETEQTEAENQLLKLEKQQAIQQRNRTLIALGILLLLLTTLGLLYRKVLHARRQIASQNLELAELNHTKNQLFAIIAHDLRGEASAFQQLAQIVGFHLRNRNLERLEQVFGQVNKSATNLNTLLDNLLQWALSQLKGIRLQPAKLQLRHEAAQSLQLFEAHAKLKDITLSNEVPEGLSATADQNSIQLILRNLISNAIKFTPPGGHIRLSGEQAGKQVILLVEDTGRGMPEEQAATIMEGQSVGSREGTSGERGTGLGLSLCREFAIRNQGAFEIKTQPGAGTQCRVYLPGSD